MGLVGRGGCAVVSWSVVLFVAVWFPTGCGGVIGVGGCVSSRGAVRLGGGSVGGACSLLVCGAVVLGCSGDCGSVLDLANRCLCSAEAVKSFWALAAMIGRWWSATTPFCVHARCSSAVMPGTIGVSGGGGWVMVYTGVKVGVSLGRVLSGQSASSGGRRLGWWKYRSCSTQASMMAWW